MNPYSKSADPLMTDTIVIIPSFYSREELENPTIGGTAIIKYQIEELKKKQRRPIIIPLLEHGVISLLLKCSKVIRKRGITHHEPHGDGKSYQWTLNLVFNVLIHWFTGKDFLLYRSLKKALKKERPGLILFNAPYMSNPVIRIARKLMIPVGIFAMTHEFKFYQHNVEMKNVITRLFLRFLKHIEFNVLKKADYVFAMSEEDRDTIREFLRENGKVRIWLPKPQQREKNGKKNVRHIDPAIKAKLKKKFTAAFLGSNFKVNVDAVREIIKIAKKINEGDIFFLIIGTICDAFKNETLPENILLAGFVDNLDECLKMCDIFLNPKVTFTLGVEIKLIDYLKTGKPVISTTMGASGITGEEREKIIIEDDLEKWESQIMKLYRMQREG